jgi:hypothetical protein
MWPWSRKNRSNAPKNSGNKPRGFFSRFFTKKENAPKNSGNKPRGFLSRFFTKKENKPRTNSGNKPRGFFSRFFTKKQNKPKVPLNNRRNNTQGVTLRNTSNSEDPQNSKVNKKVSVLDADAPIFVPDQSKVNEKVSELDIDAPIFVADEAKVASPATFQAVPPTLLQAVPPTVLQAAPPTELKLTSPINFTRKGRIAEIASRKSFVPDMISGEYAPKNLYLMMGHGAEFMSNIPTEKEYRDTITKLVKLYPNNDKILPKLSNGDVWRMMHSNNKNKPSSKERVVPDGCLLVVQVHAGEVNYLPATTYANVLNNAEKLLDPIKNYKEVVDTINKGRIKGNGTRETLPVAIYYPGDQYPNFQYSVFDLEDRPDEKIYKICNSGIAKYTSGDSNNTFKKLYELIEYDDLSGADKIVSMFEKSMYPTAETVREFIDGLTMMEAIKKLTSMKGDKIIRVFQSDIFDMIKQPNSGFEKGVYYNIICRATVSSLLEKNMGRKVIRNNARSLINYTDGPHIIKKGKNEILAGISEAVGQRARHVRQLNVAMNSKEKPQ